MSSQCTGRWRVHINMGTFILCTVKGLYKIGGFREIMHPPYLENCYTYGESWINFGSLTFRTNISSDHQASVYLLV